MRILKTSVLIVLAIALIVFSIQNMESVRLSFLIWHLEIPLSFASVLMYILGAVSGGIVFSILKKLSVDKSNEKKRINNNTNL